MDIDKVGRVHSYVQAQLPFVPFYGTGLFAPVDSLHGAFGPQTPILVARNPHVNIQRELDSLSASTYLEIQGSGRLPAQADFTLAKKSTEVRKDRSMYHPLRADKRKRPLRLKRCIQITPDPGPIAEPAKERTPMKSQRNRRCEKPRLPTTLSFLYGLTPKNIGPSRLTIPAGDKGVFGKGKSSSIATKTPLLDLTAHPVFCGEPESTAAGAQPPSTSSCTGFDHSQLFYPRNHKHVPELTGKIVEDVSSRVEESEAIRDTRSAIRDIELEDGTHLSDSSLFSWGSTVVIHTERIWNHQGGIKRSLQTPTGSYGQPHSLAGQSPDESPRSSPRVASRFFPNCVAGSRTDRSISSTQIHDWEAFSGRGPEALARDDFTRYHHTGTGRDHGSNQNTDSFSGSSCGTYLSSLTAETHQEIMSDQSDMQDFNTSLIDLTNREGGNLPVSDLSLEVDYEVLLDLGAPERGHRFFEGRRLLLRG